MVTPQVVHVVQVVNAAVIVVGSIVLVFALIGVVRAEIAYRRAQRALWEAWQEWQAMVERHERELPRRAPLAEPCDDEKRGDASETTE